ncbi:MAG: hypothetical protein QNJ91_06020 [Gammaproteobacteria bacterium]|nr:hypothetical protein [Gammaproteobacteria bacterium]
MPGQRRGVSVHGRRYPAWRSTARTGDFVHGLQVSYREAAIELAADARPVWSTQQVGARFVSRQALYAHPDGWVLDVACQGRGRLLIGEHEVVVDWRGGTPPEHYLRTFGLAILLERQGALCLHANALARDGRAIALLGPSRAGKSTLAQALVARGWRLLGDDMATVRCTAGRWSVSPSRGEIRLWPDAGRFFHGDAYDACPRVHRRFAKRVIESPAAPAARSVPLSRVFVIDRCADSAQARVHSDALAAADATICLLQNSVLGDASRALGIEGRRLAALARLVQALAVDRLRYRSGLEHVDSVAAAVEARADAAPPEAGGGAVAGSGCRAATGGRLP